MKSRKGPIALMVAGGLLALGPIFGLLGTMIAMIRTFDTIRDSGQGSAERLASSIGASLWATVAGLAILPIGLALLIGGIVWIVRSNKEQKTSNQQIQPIAGKPGSG